MQFIRWQENLRTLIEPAMIINESAHIVRRTENCNLVPRSPLGMRESKPLEKTKTHVILLMEKYRIVWGISLIKERFIETMTSSG